MAVRLVVVAGVAVREGRIMLCQRRSGVHNALKWEFPGGKLEDGESPEAAPRRELREELSIDVRVGRIVDAVVHRYPDRDVLLMFYRCDIVAGEPEQGVLDSVTLQAVAEFQSRANEQYDAGLHIIDPGDPGSVVDVNTLNWISRGL